MNRVTRDQFSTMVKAALDENKTDVFKVAEAEDGHVLTLADTLETPPVLGGSYNGLSIRDAGLPTLTDAEMKEAERRIKNVNLERTVQFCISDDSVDRYGDIVRPKGMDKKAYRNNPVVLWGHEYFNPNVGNSLKEWVESNKVKSVGQFIEGRLYPFADFVYEMLKAGHFRAVSIGFIPTETTVRKSEGENPRFLGYEFKKWELLEYSVVTVPANANALVEAKSAGIDVSPFKSWAEKVLDAVKESDPFYQFSGVSKRELTKVYKTTFPDGTTTVDLGDLRGTVATSGYIRVLDNETLEALEVGKDYVFKSNVDGSDNNLLTVSGRLKKAEDGTVAIEWDDETKGEDLDIVKVKMLSESVGTICSFNGKTAIENARTFLNVDDAPDSVEIHAKDPAGEHIVVEGKDVDDALESVRARLADDPGEPDPEPEERDFVKREDFNALEERGKRPRGPRRVVRRFDYAKRRRPPRRFDYVGGRGGGGESGPY